MALKLILLNKPIYGGIYTLCQTTTTGEFPRPAKLQGARDPAGEILPSCSPQMHRRPQMPSSPLTQLSPPMRQILPIRQSLPMATQANRAIPADETAEIRNPNRLQAPRSLLLLVPRDLPGLRHKHIPQARELPRRILSNLVKGPRAGVASRPRNPRRHLRRHVPRGGRPQALEILFWLPLDQRCGVDRCRKDVWMS